MPEVVSCGTCTDGGLMTGSGGVLKVMEEGQAVLTAARVFSDQTVFAGMRLTDLLQ